MLQVVRKISTIFPKDTELPSNGVDDMTKLTYLDEPGVLQNLSCRFGVNEIYVSIYIICSSMYFSVLVIQVIVMTTSADDICHIWAATSMYILA